MHPTVKWELSWAIHLVLIVGNTALSAVILVGGPSRFSPLANSPIEALGTSVWPWSLVLLATVMLMMTGHVLPDMIGLVMGAAWMYTVAAILTVSMLESPTASGTGPVIYFTLGLVHVMVFAHRLLGYLAVRGKGRV